MLRGVGVDCWHVSRIGTAQGCASVAGGLVGSLQPWEGEQMAKRENVEDGARVMSAPAWEVIGRTEWGVIYRSAYGLTREAAAQIAVVYAADPKVRKIEVTSPAQAARAKARAVARQS